VPRKVPRGLLLVLDLVVKHQFVKGRYPVNHREIAEEVRVEVSPGISIDLVLLVVYHSISINSNIFIKFTYNASLASNPTRFSSSSTFRGLGFFITFV
jgi:hypothetical protein